MSASRSASAVPRIRALSLEAPVSEAEFLRREIGLDIDVVSAATLLEQAQGPRQPILVVISEPDAYIEFIKSAPHNSVVPFLISDEGYSPNRLALVQDSPSVRAVFRHYGVEPASLADILAASWQFAWSTRSSDVSVRNLPQLMSTGRKTRHRMREWRQLSVPVHGVPLGYTSDFARQLIKQFDLTIGPDESLIDAVAKSNQERSRGAVFRGARGTAHRRALIESAQREPGADIAWVDGDWSPSTSTNRVANYVDLLSGAKRALCPPGSVNTETFRYYEAIVCGAEPIEPRTALTHLGRPVARGARPKENFRLALQHVQTELRTSLEGSHGDSA